MDDDLDSVSGFRQSGAATPTTTVANFYDFENKNGEAVNHVNTVAGQRVGAILVVKRTPSKVDHDGPEVGDLVKLMSIAWKACKVEILKSGRIHDVRWEVFLPLSPKDRCTCLKGLCGCTLAYPAQHFVGQAETKPSLAVIPTPQSHQAPVLPPTSTVFKDPATFEGQQIGAILVIKQKVPGSYNSNIAVGDFVKLVKCEGAASRVRVQNLRTEWDGEINWGAVFPVTERGTCDCWDNSLSKLSCRCIYVDFEKSRAFLKQDHKPRSK